MSGNVIKSDEGWVRLQARVKASKGRVAVRTARMDYSVPKPKPVKIEESDGEAIVVNGRRRRRAFVAHNGRY